MQGELMPQLRAWRLVGLALIAGLLAAGSALAALGKGGDFPKTVFYVKDGDTFREATEIELKAAVGSAVPAHGNEHKSGGVGFAGIRYDLGIYTLIVFGILMFILSKYAWPHIREGLDKREVNIRSVLDQAKQGQVEATALLAAAKRQMDEGAVQVKAMLDEARRDADVLRAGEREAAARDIAAEKDRAKREIAAEKDAILKDVYDQSVKLAALMSEKALRRSISPDDHRRLLDESLSELRTASKA
jgi:F-type H+-transporting ATPase subunit b